MTEDKTGSANAIFDQRFGSLRHLLGQPDEVGGTTHAVKKEAAKLLLDSLDCLHDAIEARKNGEAIDDSVLMTLQRRLEGVVRMQRLLGINDAERCERIDTGSQIARG